MSENHNVDAADPSKEPNEKPTDEIPAYNPKSPAPKTIQDATTFDELNKVLRAKGKVKGTPLASGQVNEYPAEHLIKMIEELRARAKIADEQTREALLTGKTLYNRFTRSEGLKAKVMELTKKEIEKSQAK